VAAVLHPLYHHSKASQLFVQVTSAGLAEEDLHKALVGVSPAEDWASRSAQWALVVLAVLDEGYLVQHESSLEAARAQAARPMVTQSV
jgi:hypothetical protein